MRIGIPREIKPGERRVAATPESVRRLGKLGFEVSVEAQAGQGASYPDAAYADAGARIVAESATIWGESDIVLKVQPPDWDPKAAGHEADALREGSTLVSFIWPAKSPELLERLARRRATVLAMDQIPRITRAQKVDALSSMANIAGYRAVIEAASFYGRFFTGQMTAAGKVPAAKVLVIGAGVAGLAAIGTARGLGAIVRAFDTRPEVREQVHSMGAEFLQVALDEEGSGAGGYARQMSEAFLAAEMELFSRQAREVDIIITTALIPGKPAPQLITDDMVASMHPGSVIVDLAAEAGGNCAATRPGEVRDAHGVHIVGYVDLPSRLAPTASQLYASNLTHLLADMGGAKSWHVDVDDAVVRGALVLRDGKLTWPPPKPEPAPSPASGARTGPPRAGPASAAAPPDASTPQPSGQPRRWLASLLALGLVALLGWGAPPAFLSHLTIFILACFVGWQVIWNVTPALHTPLMSVTNAISGIIIIGGMLQLTTGASAAVVALSSAAVLLATINITGGFVVTQRMLRMFRR